MTSLIASGMMLMWCRTLRFVELYLSHFHFHSEMHMQPILDTFLFLFFSFFVTTSEHQEAFENPLQQVPC